MKILHTSDLHIGRYLNEYSLLEDQQYILNQILNKAVQNNVDIILISGDLFDRSVPSSDAVSLLDGFFYNVLQNGIKIIAICGNHDGRRRMGFLSRMCTASGIYLKNEFDPHSAKLTFKDKFGNVNFYMIPYIDPSEISSNEHLTFNSAFSNTLELACENFNPSERNIILAHGFFAGVGCENEALFSESEISVGPADMISAEPLKQFDYAALGHLHRAQKAGAEHIRYSGSPLKYSIDEASVQKIVSIVTLNEKSNVKIEDIPLTPMREVRTLRGSFDDLIHPADKSDFLNDYVYAQITDDSIIPDAMSKLRSVYPNILGMRIISRDNEKSAALNIDSDLREKEPIELFCEFYSSLKDSPLIGRRREIVQEIFDEINKKRFPQD